jgi:hypothetical protein
MSAPYTVGVLCRFCENDESSDPSRDQRERSSADIPQYPRFPTHSYPVIPSERSDEGSAVYQECPQRAIAVFATPEWSVDSLGIVSDSLAFSQ